MHPAHDSQPASPVEARVPSMLRALDRILSPSGFPYGSNFRLFKYAQFGRDALEMADDLLDYRPGIAHTVILRLAELQGKRTDAASEEEPGRIHHEYRAQVMDGEQVDAEAMDIFRHLAALWFDVKEGDPLPPDLVYYGTVDATPLYVMLVCRYCRLYGRSILDELYVSARDGSTGTIRDSVRAAAAWVEHRLESSDLGLLEFLRSNPKGHHFQAWKDGGASYIRPDGTLANFRAPIASVEVQGLAYEALVMAAHELPEIPDAVRRSWLDRARALREATLEHFWMPEARYFALAVDRDPVSGAPRQVDLLASNAGALLATGIFDGLGDEERQRYVSGVVDRIYSGEFLTDVGIRCSAVCHKDVLDYPGYQSTHTVWHKETYDIARGLERQGFPLLARDVDTRLLNGVNVAGKPSEFLYVMPDGRVHYERPDRVYAGPPEEIVGTNIPERDQAWTISATLAVKRRRGQRHSTLPPRTGWQQTLEDDLLRRVPPVSVLRTVDEVEAALPTTYAFFINVRRAWEHEHALMTANRMN